MKRAKNTVMKRRLSYIISVVLFTSIIVCTTPVFAEENNNEGQLNAAIGFVGTVGYYDINEVNGNAYFSPALGYGGGLVFETMFNNNFGIHSGLHYEYTEMEFTFFGTTNFIDAKVRFHILNLPICMLLSFNTESFSFQLLLGTTISQIVSARMYTEDPTLSDSVDDALPYIYHTRVSITAGMLFRFRITRFTDFFFGVVSDYYFTDLFQKESGMTHHPYDVKSVVGYMFRTNMFPMTED